MFNHFHLRKIVHRARVRRNMSKEGVVMCWPIPRNTFSTRRYPQTSTFSPNPAHRIKVTRDEKTRLACTPEDHGQARQCVHHGSKAISCPTNVPSIESLISLGCSDSPRFRTGRCEIRVILIYPFRPSSHFTSQRRLFLSLYRYPRQSGSRLTPGGRGLKNAR